MAIFELPIFESVVEHYFLQALRPSLRDTGLLTLATVRASRLVSGRNDQTLPTVLKPRGGTVLLHPDLLKSLES